MNQFSKTNYSDEFYTPRWLFNQLHSKFDFTLDPASCAIADKGILFFTQEDDGLSKDWSGQRIFCNPPYSLIKQFVEKTSTITEPSVFLIPCRPETRYWHKHICPHASEIFVFNKRIQFERPDGTTAKAATFATVLIGFRGVKFENMESLGVRIKMVDSE